MHIRNDDYIRRAYERRGFRLALVGDTDFMSEVDAKKLLGLWSRAGVRMLVTGKAIDPCVSRGGSVGVTRASVEHELMRRKSATVSDRVRRTIRSLTRFF